MVGEHTARPVRFSAPRWLQHDHDDRVAEIPRARVERRRGADERTIRRSAVSPALVPVAVADLRGGLRRRADHHRVVAHVHVVMARP